jgi:hypothetical protein
MIVLKAEDGGGILFKKKQIVVSFFSLDFIDDDNVCFKQVVRVNRGSIYLLKIISAS